MKIEFIKFTSDAIQPTKGSDFAAGFDLYSVENIMIPPAIS